MENLKKAYKGSFAKSPFDVIFWGDPSTATFQEAISIYQSSGLQQKSEIQERILRKLNKDKEPQICLSILFLIDKLMSRSYAINIQHIRSKIDTCRCKSEKEKVAVQSLINFYLSFLQIESKKIRHPNSLEEETKYYGVAIQAIRKVMEFDFVITHCLSAYEHKVICRIAIISVMERVAVNLNRVKQFLETNWQNIINKHPLAFEINQIYEKALHISKTAAKLEVIKKKLQIQVELNFFKLNTSINKQIEEEMMGRDIQKKQFCSLKDIQIKYSSTVNPGGFISCPHFEQQEQLMMENYEI